MAFASTTLAMTLGDPPKLHRTIERGIPPGPAHHARPEPRNLARPTMARSGVARAGLARPGSAHSTGKCNSSRRPAARLFDTDTRHDWPTMAATPCR